MGATPRASSTAAHASTPGSSGMSGSSSGRRSRPGRGSAPSLTSGPPARSASSAWTVSAASALLVPITPVGPRLSQPATYSPGSGSPVSDRTRPLALGTVYVLVSNGTPGSGTDW